MRVLVTGSTGHVGGALVSRLRADGHTVVGASRRASASPDHVSVDIGELDSVDVLLGAVEPCAAIVHAAAVIDSDPNAPAISLTNCWGTQAMLAVAREWAVERFVYISSIGVIGQPVSLPITEEHATAPRLAYHASKLFGEYLVSVAAFDSMRAVSLRITAPVGPGMPQGRILSVFVERALRDEALVLAGSGTRRQNYVDVRDIALAVTLCLEHGPIGVMNVGGASSISNRDLADACVRVLGSSSDIRFEGEDAAEGVAWEVSSARAATTIGYEPQQSTEDSIRAVAAEL